MHIPPGVGFLAQSTLRTLVAVGTTYSTLYIFLGYGLNWQGVASYGIRASLLLASFVIFPAVTSTARTYLDWAEARRQGAVLVPRLREDFPRGLGLLYRRIRERSQTRYLGEVADNWRRKYGNTYSYNLLSQQNVFTYDPTHIKCMLATQFEAFEKGPTLFRQFRNLLGTGVFNSDGDMWKFHRNMTRPFFARDRILDFDIIMDQHALHAISLARERLAEGYAIDFQDLVSRFTLDSACVFLFGQSADSLHAGLPYPEHGHVPPPEVQAAYHSQHKLHPSTSFVEAFVEGQSRTSARGIFGPAWPLFEFWGDKVDPKRKVVDEFVGPVVQRALERSRTGMIKEELTLLDNLVTQTQDVQILKDEVINLLVAGRDTTAATLSFSLYMLTEHPEITKRLREEIGQVLGPGNVRPSTEQIKSMRYMRAFLNEVLRLYPAVPFDNRSTNQGVLLPMPANGPTGGKPYYVPPGTRCIYSVFVMHRREDLWGPDAGLFDPGRFLDERLHKYLTPNPFIFLPFNAGPRICLGQQFAYHEMSFFLIRLLQHFSSFDLAENAQPPKSKPPAEWLGNFKGTKGTDRILPTNSLTMSIKGGLWLKMIPGELPSPE